MRGPLIAALALWSSLAAAEVVNVEFKFTPFVGDPKNPKVETVAGKASVFINNVLLAEQPVRKDEVPVLFDEREIAASVWLPTASLGPALRKGKNKFRIEFEPADPKAAYRAQLRWTSVTDQVTRGKTAGGATQETNQSGAGVEDKTATGKVAFEREFVADFATDLPWHHYPAVTALSDDDKKRLASLVKQRTEAFKPNFAVAYQLLKDNKSIELAKAQEAKCLDAAYAAGVRVGAAPADQLDFATTGNPEVVVRSKNGNLYYPLDPKTFDRIKGDNLQMCVSVLFSALYPQRLVAVRAPSGEWQVVY